MQTTGIEAPTRRRKKQAVQQHKKKRLPARAVAERYGVHIKTVGEWVKDPTLNFPRPQWINRRRYFSETELDAFDVSQA